MLIILLCFVSAQWDAAHSFLNQGKKQNDFQVIKKNGTKNIKNTLVCVALESLKTVPKEGEAEILGKESMQKELQWFFKIGIRLLFFL